MPRLFNKLLSRGGKTLPTTTSTSSATQKPTNGNSTSQQGSSGPVLPRWKQHLQFDEFETYNPKQQQRRRTTTRNVRSFFLDRKGSSCHDGKRHQRKTTSITKHRTKKQQQQQQQALEAQRWQQQQQEQLRQLFQKYGSHNHWVYGRVPSTVVFENYNDDDGDDDDDKSTSSSITMSSFHSIASEHSTMEFATTNVDDNNDELEKEHGIWFDWDHHNSVSFFLQQRAQDQAEESWSSSSTPKEPKPLLQKARFLPEPNFDWEE